MDKKQQPEALKLAEMLTADEWPGSVTLVSYAQECVAELRRQHAENETLRVGYAAARLEVKSLKAQLRAAKQINAAQVGAVESNTADAAPTQGATEMENLQRTAVGWQGRALRAERNWAVCRRWAIAGGAPVEKLGDDPDQPSHAASPAIEGESKWWPCPVAAPGPADGEGNE